MCRRYFLMLLLGLISGCTTMNSKFTCKTADGVMCRSLDDVNSMVDRGELGQNFRKVETGKSAINFTPIFSKNSHVSVPLRSGESVLRIWTAPYEDSNGNYHEDSVFYTVIKPGHWIGTPPKEIVDLES